MKKLNLAPDLAIPLDSVTQTFAILGIRGSGKTNSGVDLTEELLSAGQQVVILDPTDGWWGLRSSADGKRSGYPITILGGEHADLPLDPSAGSILADFAVDNGASLVLSVRHLSMADQRRFAADFAERIYARKGEDKHKTPLHLVIDECDEFIPQRIPSGSERMFGAFDRIVRRGRIVGLGVTMIGQRAQVINKDVLSQIETLICHRLLHKLDRNAVEAWIEAHDVEGKAKEFLSSLASLGRGDAWVWSPEWLGIFTRVHMRARHTFDSSATPKAGERRIAPKQLAEVNLNELRTKLSATIERAKADDPRELRRRIAELELQVKKAAAAQPKTAAPIDPTPLIEKAVQAAVGKLRKEAASNLGILAKQLAGYALQTVTGFQLFGGDAYTPIPITRPTLAIAPARSVATADTRTPASEGDFKLGSGHRKILTALAQYPDGRADNQVAILTGYANGSGGFNNLLSSLKTAGLLEGTRAKFRITQDGINQLGDFTPLPTGHELQQHWLNKLGKCEAAILQTLCETYPRSLSDEEVAQRSGYTAGSGGFNNSISRLRTLELICGSRKELKASEDLF